jgi:hypothetical protein
MSFAFTFGSVGDIIAVAQLVAQVISALSESEGSAMEYQLLVAELHSLQKALNHLDKLSTRSGCDIKTLESIKFAAAACQRPLAAFHQKIQKYNKYLGGVAVDPNDSSNDGAPSRAESTGRDKHMFSLKKKVGSAARKIQWEFAMKSEVQKLQNYLNLHVDTINTLLAVHGIETMALDSAARQDSHNKLKELIDVTQKSLDRVSGNLDAQAAMVRSTSNIVEKLLGVVTEWNAPWKIIGDMVSKIWWVLLERSPYALLLTCYSISTQQIYGVLLEVKGSIVDIRWTYFQAPMQVEDALGYKFPVPSEYEFSLLQNIIYHRFQDDGQVAVMVQRGGYELSYANNSHQTLSSGVRLRPGSQVIMAVILEKEVVNQRACPMPRCKSMEATAVSGGGYRW